MSKVISGLSISAMVPFSTRVPLLNVSVASQLALLPASTVQCGASEPTLTPSWLRSSAKSMVSPGLGGLLGCAVITAPLDRDLVSRENALRVCVVPEVLTFGSAMADPVAGEALAAEAL